VKTNSISDSASELFRNLTSKFVANEDETGIMHVGAEEKQHGTTLGSSAPMALAHTSLWRHAAWRRLASTLLLLDVDLHNLAPFSIVLNLALRVCQKGHTRN
jgi:hypothetical protein